MKLNTIDFDNNDKELISRIIHKIVTYGSKNHCLFSFETKISQHKGVTIILKCSKECDLCRFIFDDVLRYEMDSKRPQYKQNVVWERKELLTLTERIMYNL